MNGPWRFTVVRAQTMSGTAPLSVSEAAVAIESEFTARTATDEPSLCMPVTKTYGSPPSAPGETQSTVSLSVSTVHVEAEIVTSPAPEGNDVSGTLDGVNPIPPSEGPASETGTPASAV